VLQVRKAPFFKGAFRVHEAFGPRLHRSSRLGIFSQPFDFGSEGQSWVVYFFFFLVAFFFIVALSFGLDFVTFFFTGIDTSSSFTCCSTKLQTLSVDDLTPPDLAIIETCSFEIK
jgi:hypothetical protein